MWHSGAHSSTVRSGIYSGRYSRTRFGTGNKKSHRNENKGGTDELLRMLKQSRGEEGKRGKGDLPSEKVEQERNYSIEGTEMIHR